MPSILQRLLLVWSSFQILIKWHINFNEVIKIDAGIQQPLEKMSKLPYLTRITFFKSPGSTSWSSSSLGLKADTSTGNLIRILPWPYDLTCAQTAQNIIPLPGVRKRGRHETDRLESFGFCSNYSSETEELIPPLVDSSWLSLAYFCHLHLTCHFPWFPPAMLHSSNGSPWLLGDTSRLRSRALTE